MPDYGVVHKTFFILVLSTNGAAHTSQGQRPWSRGGGKKLLLIGLHVPWSLPKADMGRAFGPKSRSH